MWISAIFHGAEKPYFEVGELKEPSDSRLVSPFEEGSVSRLP